MVNVTLSLGSNIGDRWGFIGQMRQMLLDVLSAPMVVSSYMESEPVEVATKQDWYANCLLNGWYQGDPSALLAACRTIETALGRDKKGQRAPRTADIDILLFGDSLVSLPNLTIPHPELLNRRFCIEGLFEIMPDRLLAGTKKTIREHYVDIPLSVAKQQLRYTAFKGNA